MNRRKALKGLLLLGGSGAAILGGIKGYRLFRSPDLQQLSHYRPLIAELAETIIPRTDTPGAKDAGVPDFIITMIKDCTPLRIQNRFMDGLEDVVHYAHAQYGHSFFACSQEQRHNILAHFEKRDRPYSGLPGKVSRKLFGDTFFITLKHYTVQGYCTSMQGATQALAYDYVPGRYQGCATLEPGQKCWAT
ncbi:gluconate 2-dehydrogenase subunit 3 family protein [Chitinophaga agrisoli]|uniref:Gluconate 2-dehydrogenase subunit 3 family protein n=1 Tax=Chitinophaga agrisoli TaxID=2607653 RepID=A0A5B2VTU7_9BACT|nr:gluconate 2-dehydrogenase subunit 3 family protein [Chitinophaga agrisoli]KAA2242455.1 gluconate 2-dehydrogenase subunit 3 family protein [Chitinophaga agrisoli]